MKKMKYAIANRRLNRAELLQIVDIQSRLIEDLKNALNKGQGIRRDIEDIGDIEDKGDIEDIGDIEGEEIHRQMESYGQFSDRFHERIERELYQNRYNRVIRNTIHSLILVAAIAILIATLFLPVLKIYGTSMTPTLTEGNIIVSLKGEHFKTGDVIAFYYNNKILVKRVIGHAGDWIDIEEDGTVLVNGQMIEEPYLDKKAIGDCNITLPYQVPDSKVFVMGDHREASIDSRNTSVGCVAQEQIVGRILFKVWPLKEFGPIR